MAIDAKKHVSPAAGETPTRAQIAAMILSANDVVPVSGLTERGQVVSALNAIGAGPTASKPLIVSRADAPVMRSIEWTFDGTNWAAVGQLTFADIATAKAWAAANPSMLANGDHCTAGGVEYTWRGGWMPLLPEVRILNIARISVPTGTTRYALVLDSEVTTAARTPTYPAYTFDAPSGRFTLEKGQYLIGVDAYVDWAFAGAQAHVALVIVGDTRPAAAQANFGGGQSASFMTEQYFDGSTPFTIEGFHNVGSTQNLRAQLKIVRLRQEA